MRAIKCGRADEALLCYNSKKADCLGPITIRRLHGVQEGLYDQSQWRAHLPKGYCGGSIIGAQASVCNHDQSPPFWTEFLVEEDSAALETQFARRLLLTLDDQVELT